MHDVRCLKILLWKESAYTCFPPCSFSPDVPGVCCPEPCLWGTAVSANPRRAERGAPLRLNETVFPSPSAQPHVFAAGRLRPGAEGSRCLRIARRDGRQPPPPAPGQPRGARPLTAGAAAPPAARATGRGTFSARAGEGPRRKGLEAATPTPTPSLAAPHLF